MRMQGCSLILNTRLFFVKNRGADSNMAQHDQYLVSLGVGGLPRARPYFGLDAEDGIRHKALCCGTPPGPKVPYHWLEAGLGWVTKYFTDVVSLDRENKQLGRYRCQMPQPNGQPCSYEIADEQACCTFGPCWNVKTNVPFAMMAHVGQHGIMPTTAPRRQWSSALCDTDGCCEVLWCAPCNGSRQMMALSGHEDTFSWAWCLFFCLAGFQVEQRDEQTIVYWIPPHLFVALFTRFRVVRLNNIDESFCSSMCNVCCCSICSVAQTYRELSAAGVWPGSSCGSDKPPYYGTLDMGAQFKPSQNMA